MTCRDFREDAMQHLYQCRHVLSSQHDNHDNQKRREGTCAQRHTPEYSQRQVEDGARKPLGCSWHEGGMEPSASAAHSKQEESYESTADRWHLRYGKASSVGLS